MTYSDANWLKKIHFDKNAGTIETITNDETPKISG